MQWGWWWWGWGWWGWWFEMIWVDFMLFCWASWSWGITSWFAHNPASHSEHVAFLEIAARWVRSTAPCRWTWSRDGTRHAWEPPTHVWSDVLITFFSVIRGYHPCCMHLFGHQSLLVSALDSRYKFYQILSNASCLCCLVLHHDMAPFTVSSPQKHIDQSPNHLQIFRSSPRAWW